MRLWDWRPRRPREPAGCPAHTPSQPDGVDGEEVAGHDSGGLLAKERPPGAARPPRCRVEPVAAQRREDRGRRGLHAKLLKFAFDALVAPVGVLSGEADDQLLEVVVQRWPTGLAGWVGPRACDEAAGSSLGRGVWRRNTMS
jgi:hypothetical protein